MKKKKPVAAEEPADLEVVEVEEEKAPPPDEREAIIEGLKKELLYQAAELENFKRRTEKRYADALKFASEPLLKEMLTVLDNLERAKTHAAEENTAISEGLGHIADQFREAIYRHGVEEIAAEGSVFDPNFHEALAMVPGAEDGKVVMVHEKGYTIHGKLLRPSKVLVSKVA